MRPRDAKLLVIVLVAALLLPCAFAEQSATVSFDYFSTSSECATSRPGPVTAGELVYAKFRIQNTGDVDLINMRFFLIDFKTFTGNWNEQINYGKYMYPIVTGLEIPRGGALTLCYPMQTISTYEAGTWTMVPHFQATNDLNVNPWSPIDYTIANPGVYESLEILMSPTEPYVQAVGQQQDITVTVRNKNPDAPFAGTLFLTQWVTFTDGSTSRPLALAPGGQQSFVLRTMPMPEPFWNYIGVHAQSDSGRDIKRGWYQFHISGDIYRYWMWQSYTAKPIHQPAEQGTVRAYVMNYGNKEWNSDCCSYRMLIQAKDDTGSWRDVYDKTTPFSAPQAIDEYRWFEESFTNTLSTPMTDYKVCWYLIANGQPGNSYWWECTSYSPANYPDITDACAITTEETSTDLLLKQNCSAGGNSVVFIGEQTEGFSGIQATAGTMSSWAQTSRNGKKGVLIQGSTDAQYLVTYKTYKIIEMDAVAPWIFVVLAATACALAALRRPRA